ncbi:MAG: ATP-binding protein [Magnetovibrionaceae bacterium]
MTQKNENTLIGYVTDVQAGAVAARLIDREEDGPFIVTIGSDDVLVGRVCSYVAVKQREDITLGMVTRMSETERLLPLEPGSSASETIRSTRIDRDLSITPLGTLNDQGEFHRGVSAFPTTGAEVHALGPNDIGKMFARFQSKGYDVGYLPSTPSQSVYFDPTGLFGRHFAILGQTGAGKSHTVANLLQCATKKMQKAHVILLDLHGEYSWVDEKGDRKFAFQDGVARYVDARSLEIPYWLMTFEELCDLLVDHSEREAANQIAFFKDTLFAQKTTENASVGLERISLDTPIYFPLEELVAQVQTENTRMVQGSNGLKKGPLFGDFDRFLIRLNSKLNDVRYDFLLKPQVRKTSDTLEGLLRDFVGLGEPEAAITIIDLSSVPFDVRPTVAAQIGRLAFEFNYWNPEYRDFPLGLICEEAHAYIPRDNSGQYAGARKSMERIAKEGRKYGVGLGVVSQRPHELSETVLAQCGSFICLRVTNPTDQAYVKNLVPEAERNLLDTLSGLGRGEAMALGEAVPLPTRVQFNRADPEPNSDDIDFYNRWIDGPDDIDVSAIVDRWRRQERSE